MAHLGITKKRLRIPGGVLTMAESCIANPPCAVCTTCCDVDIDFPVKLYMTFSDLDCPFDAECTNVNALDNQTYELNSYPLAFDIQDFWVGLGVQTASIIWVLGTTNLSSKDFAYAPSPASIIPGPPRCQHIRHCDYEGFSVDDYLMLALAPGCIDEGEFGCHWEWTAWSAVLSVFSPDESFNVWQGTGYNVDTSSGPISIDPTFPEWPLLGPYENMNLSLTGGYLACTGTLDVTT